MRKFIAIACTALVLPLVAVGDLQVTTKGKDGKVNVTTWGDEEFSYSISFHKDGVDGNIISDIISSIY